MSEQERKKLLSRAVKNQWSYNKYLDIGKEKDIRTYRKQQYYYIRKEYDNREIKLEELEEIKRFKDFRRDLYKEKEKEKKQYSIEFIGQCKVYQHIPDGTKKFIRDELISGTCCLNYNEAKENFNDNFNNRRDAIWDSQEEELVLISIKKKEWCL